MSLILNIDTATEQAQVSIARDGSVLGAQYNQSQKDHASFLQVAIQQLAKETGITVNMLDAVAVTAGPGSYTGLRVGMASAKGLCFALNKPLITLNTLVVWAASAISSSGYAPISPTTLLCPMIDARRMEVFTAVYNKQLNIVMPSCAMILDENSFTSLLLNNNILFFGSGAQKWKALCPHSKALFISVAILPEAMSKLSNQLYTAHQFTELADSQPLYLKEFQDGIKK